MRSRVDWLLLCSLLLLIVMGLITLNSAAAAVTGGKDLFERQLIFVGIGLTVGAVVFLVNYRVWLAYAPILYGVGIGLLLAVLFFGTTIHGSKSWLDLGAFRLQPSEAVKVALLLTLAWMVREDKRSMLRFRDLLRLGIAAAVPTALILVQPDFGTASTLIALTAAVCYLLGLRARVYVFLILLAVGTGWVSWHYLFKPYQKERVLTVFNPERDPLGRGYHVIQSKVAVGSGRLTGRGYMKGTQSKLKYLPEPHTDFIFAVFAEEFGLAGVLVALGCMLLLISRMINIARVAYDKPGMVLAFGGAMLLLYQMLVSTGMIVGLIPTTGIPLPFFSYGGSAVISYIAVVALALNVFRNRFERV